MMRRIAIAAGVPLALVLAGCQDQAAAPVNTGAQRAEGEVLGGSISDEMIPLDTLTSQSPPRKVSPREAAEADGEGVPAARSARPSSDAEAREEEPAAAPAEAPAETSEPED